MSDTNQNINILRTLVEEAADHRVSTSTDFAFLSGCIQGRLHQTVSVSTLERIWGYIEGYQTIRESTLDILARFIGFADWRTFVSDYCSVPSARSSHRLSSPTITANDIASDALITIEWNPGRRCTLRHLGEGRWRVEESIKSKLAPGDTFRCDRFTVGFPLFLDQYRHGDDEPSLFVVGNRGGLTAINS